MDTKYFAYYIPENNSIIMNNIMNVLKEDYGLLNSHQVSSQIFANIQLNDLNISSDENINYLNSLVLVKFVSVNDIFVKRSNINRNNSRNENVNDISNGIGIINNNPTDDKNVKIMDIEYQKISSNSEHFRKKYTNSDYSKYKLKNIFFTGVQYHIGINDYPNDEIINNDENDTDLEYIFAETIIIPLVNIMNIYTSIKFDSNGNNEFNNELDKYIRKNEINDVKIINIYAHIYHLLKIRI